MGYRCPVCDDPQADDIHLANHLAFTAIARGGAHEAWLDEHVPDWGQLGDTGLAEEVTELAGDADYPRLFEDTTDVAHDHDHDHSDDMGANIPADVADLPGADDDEIRDIIEEARELTRERRRGSDDTTDSDDDE